MDDSYTMNRIPFVFGFLLVAFAVPSVGAAQPTSCGTCGYLTEYCDQSGSTCTSCSGACPTGSYESAQCGGGDGYSDRACSSCMANCNSCTSATICDECASEHWFNPSPIGSQIGDPGECQACTTCQQGEVETQACTPFINRQCAASCPDGTMQSGNTCVDCGVSDCATCSAPGLCTACMDGFFVDNGSCTACSSCAAGEHIAVACAADHDVTCEACAAGSFSSGADAASCTPCAVGSYAASAGATSCTACATATEVGSTQCPPESVCGDGIVAADEDCDNGPGQQIGFGCDDNCQVAAGWACTGSPSVCSTVCGDGIVIDPYEDCDDGNTESNDGCSPMCEGMFYWVCTGAPSQCSRVGTDSGCSTVGGRTPPLPWLALPIAFVVFAWRRRRMG